MNFSDKARSVIATIAPLVGTALGGPFGGLAGTVLGKLFSKDGMTPATDKDVEAAVMSGDPDALLKLKQANNEFAEHMKQLDIDEQKLVFDDRANARAMAVATKDTTPRNLSYLLLAFTGIVIACEFMGISKIEGTLAGTLIGYLISENKAVLAYWFGTSSASEKKTDVISDIAKS